MSYARDEAMRQQEATEAVIGMREPHLTGLHPSPLEDLETCFLTMQEALHNIHRYAHSDGARTFDDCIRDLERIDKDYPLNARRENAPPQRVAQGREGEVGCRTVSGTWPSRRRRWATRSAVSGRGIGSVGRPNRAQVLTKFRFGAFDLLPIRSESPTYRKGLRHPNTLASPAVLLEDRVAGDLFPHVVPNGQKPSGSRGSDAP